MGTKKYKIEGKVIDANSFEILVGVEISTITKGNKNKISSAKTDNEGNYSIDVILETNSSNISIEQPSLKFTFSPKYSEYYLIPFRKDNSLIENPNPIKLKLNSQNLDEQKAQYKQIGTDTLKKATDLIPKSPEEALINFIKSQIKILLNTLLPAILTMIATFGIDKLQDFLKGNGGVCPKQSKINELIKLRNQIVDQLNKISKTLDILIKAVGIAQGLIAILKVAFNIILALPIPIPPFLPQNIIQKGADIVQSLKKLADKFTSVSVTVLMALLIIKSIIALILSLLKALDNLLLICYPSSILIGLDDNLISIQNEIDNVDNVTNQNIGGLLTRRINGFTLEIQVIEINSIGGLKRKQAIAKNSQNIIMISGEPSFSASEQILLDELEFYITSNNLKAQ